MKKITLLKAILLIAIFSSSMISVLADTYSYTFTAAVWTNSYGSKTLNSVSWTAAATGGGYWGYDTGTSDRGQQFGSSTKPATALSLTTSGISGAITSVKVTTSGASSVAATVSVSVGGTAFTYSGASTATITATSTTYEFTGSGSGAIVISWAQTTSKALYIKSLNVTYGTPSTPSITVSPTSLTGFSYYAASGPSAEQTFTVSGSNLTGDIALSAPTDYEISTTSGSGFGSSATLTQSSGSVASTPIYVRLKSGLAAGNYNSETITASSTGATDQTVTCSGTVAATTPTITVTETSVPAFTAVGCSGTKTQTINVSGVYLTGNITFALSGTNADQFSVSPNPLTPTSGTVASTPVTITYTPTSTGSHSATLTISSPGATDVTRSLTGTASSISAPVATAATAEGNSGFTANWDAVTGATTYTLTAYKKSGTQTLEGFDSAPTAPTGWTFTGVSSYTSSSTGYFATSAPSVKFGGTGNAILSPLYSLAPSKISFWIRGASTDPASALLVEGSADGSSWSTIENIVPLPTTATVKTYTSVSSYKRFRFTYTKSVGNLAFDDFQYYGSDYVETPVSGSPFTGLTSTSKSLSGLQGGSTYYYTVTASNDCGTTAASNEIMANTTTTGVDNTTSGLKPYVSNGNIMVSASAGQLVDVYNAVGQKLASKVAIDGLNSISVNAKGVVIVKVGNSITKLAL